MHDHILLQLAIILAAAKIGGEICERLLKQPAVLGEIVLGVLVGGSVFGWINGTDPILAKIAEIGAVLLLFEVGLESDIDELFRVGGAALWVACSGVILAFALGFGVSYWLGQAPLSATFIGAAVTATSVGITARVFSDLKSLSTKEARIVLGAAVADDVIGLIIVAAVSGLAVAKVFSIVVIGKLTATAILFLVGAILIGLRATPYILKLAAGMRTRAALPSVAVILCFLLATLAEYAQLAAIVGAFAAGLVLAKTEHKIHFEHRIKSIADIFIPVFFVMMGAQMKLSSFDPSTVAGRTTLLTGALLLIAVTIGKVLAGLTLPIRGAKRLMVGIGMIPRGEVTLIAALIGLKAHIISDSIYAAIIFVVICTTFVTPPLLKWVIGSGDPKGGEEQAKPADPVVSKCDPAAEAA